MRISRSQAIATVLISALITTTFSGTPAAADVAPQCLPGETVRTVTAVQRDGVDLNHADGSALWWTGAGQTGDAYLVDVCRTDLGQYAVDGKYDSITLTRADGELLAADASYDFRVSYAKTSTDRMSALVGSAAFVDMTSTDTSATLTVRAVRNTFPTNCLIVTATCIAAATPAATTTLPAVIDMTWYFVQSGTPQAAAWVSGAAILEVGSMCLHVMPGHVFAVQGPALREDGTPTDTAATVYISQQVSANCYLQPSIDLLISHAAITRTIDGVATLMTRSDNPSGPDQYSVRDTQTCAGACFDLPHVTFPGGKEVRYVVRYIYNQVTMEGVRWSAIRNSHGKLTGRNTRRWAITRLSGDCSQFGHVVMSFMLSPGNACVYRVQYQRSTLRNHKKVWKTVRYTEALRQ